MLSQISTRFVTDVCREEVSSVRSVVLDCQSSRFCHLAGGVVVFVRCGAPPETTHGFNRGEGVKPDFGEPPNSSHGFNRGEGGTNSDSGLSYSCPAVLTVGRQQPKQPQRNLVPRTVFDVDGEIGVGYAFDLALHFFRLLFKESKFTNCFL